MLALAWGALREAEGVKVRLCDTVAAFRRY